jgi:riboflavin biosynthesis pyrimidine reductase
VPAAANASLSGQSMRTTGSRHVAAGLVDEMVLHVVPRLAGRGLRLFDAARAELCCTEVTQAERALHLSYEVR